MPYNSETSQYERRATTVIDATPDGDTVAVAIDVKLDQGIDDYVTDLNHHAANGRHYPATSVASDSRFLKQSPAGEVSWADGVVAANAALKDFSNVASGAISPAKIAQDASNRFVTDAETANWNAAKNHADSPHAPSDAQKNSDITKAEIEAKLTGPITSHVHDVGAVVISTGDTAPAGTLPAIGALVSRTIYSRLWAYAQTSGNISADDASWTKGQYSPGDGSTTFRVPDLQDQFIRGASGTRAVGHGEADELKSHAHNYTDPTIGKFLLTADDNGAATEYPIPNAGITTSFGGAETRPKNVAYLMCIRY